MKISRDWPVSWDRLRARRMVEPGVVEEYEATRLAYELGQAVRHHREALGAEGAG